MTEKLELQLVKKYPSLLKDYHGPIGVTPLAWGMLHDDGWYSLLDNTLEKIDLIRATTHMGITISTVKEKFSQIRIYLHYSNLDKVNYPDLWTDIVEGIVSQAESKSGSICEVCGEYGKCCNKGYWVKTLCKEDAKKLGYKYKE
jgi:hypothetical protein